MTSNIFVSIITPTLNEEKYIEKQLKSLNQQSYARKLYEIIIVDNGSKDNTKNIARSKVDILIEAPNKNVSELRNIGAEAASGELFGFIDADCIADRDWIKNAIEYYSQGKEAFGQKVIPPEDGKWIEKAWFSQRYENEKTVSYINSANFFVSVSAFKCVNGFDRKLKSGEDSDICKRLEQSGYNIWSNPMIIVTHLKNPTNMYEFLKREVWHGLGDFYILREKRFNKTFAATVIFALGILLQIIGLLYNIKLLVAGLLITLIIITVSCGHNMIRYKNYDFLLQKTILYFFYFIGRSISMIINVVRCLRKLA